MHRFQESWKMSLEPVVDTKVNYLFGPDVGNSAGSDSVILHDKTHQQESRKVDAASILLPKEEASASQDSVVSATCSRSLPTWIQESSQMCVCHCNVAKLYSSFCGIAQQCEF